MVYGTPSTLFRTSPFVAVPHHTSHHTRSGGYTNEEYSSDSDDAPLIDVGNSSPDDADEEDGLARYTVDARGRGIEE